jgi:hypothetical protein
MEVFNKKFGMSLEKSTFTSLVYRNGLHNGIDCRLNTGYVPTQFPKGHKPWNKGKKGIVTGGKATQFKKGQVPVNYRPVGSERVNVEGYVEIKVADPKTWTYKHVFIWEEHNGQVPKGHVVIFGDGNRRNFDISNLILVSRRQLATLNKMRLVQKDAESTRTAVIIVDICHKINEKKTL